MDDLFASETGLPPSPDSGVSSGSGFESQQQQQHEPMILRDSKSYEDPVLLEDQRVLSNILNRQADLNPPMENYFEVRSL